MRLLLTVVASVAFLALAGCAGNPPPVEWGVQPLTGGDAWTYDKTVAEGKEPIVDEVRVLSPIELPWGDTTQTVQRRVMGMGQEGASRFVEFLADGTHSLGLVYRGEGQRTEGWSEQACPILPLSLTPDHVERPVCRQRLQTLADSGETTWLVVETLTTTFTIGAIEEVTTPAGSFRAVRIDVGYGSDTGSQQVVGREQPTLWYSPEACAVVREEGVSYVRELRAFRCAATGRSAGDVAPMDWESFADQATAHFGPDPAFRTCMLRPIQAGVGEVNVDLFGDHCDAEESFGGMASGLRSSEALQVSVNWTETTALQVHLVAAGHRASGEQSPIVLELSSSEVDDTFEAALEFDGAPDDDRFTLTFRVLPDPAGPGRPFLAPPSVASA